MATKRKRTLEENLEQEANRKHLTGQARKQYIGGTFGNLRKQGIIGQEKEAAKRQKSIDKGSKAGQNYIRLVESQHKSEKARRAAVRNRLDFLNKHYSYETRTRNPEIRAQLRIYKEYLEEGK